MKTKWLVFAVVGLGLAWGWWGGQQANKREYNCQVRVESLCFIWEKSDYGKGLDKVTDHVMKDVRGAP